MYSIIDIETTGGHASGNRIIEIAIFNFDGSAIVDQYHTLINPERRIPAFITSLTGIDNEMVENAPTFRDVAKEIISFTKDSIFVAHNVNFDYTFIKKELQALDIPYDRPKLCTVRLSRKLFPGFSSYSLGNLCGSLNIDIQDRHRATGDAAATVTLLSKLLEKDTDNFILKSLKKNSRETLLPAHLPREQFDALPEKAGVYYFHDYKGKVIYVGKAINIKKRVVSHFSAKQQSKQSQTFMKDIHGLSFEVCGSELISLLLESYEIKKYWPPFNRVQKRVGKNYGLYLYEDSMGYTRFSVANVNKTHTPLLSFRYQSEAREYVQAAVREHNLCYRLCGLQKTICSDVLSDICEVCKEGMPPERYNEKMMRALEALKEHGKTYIIREAGRYDGEYAVVVVENGKYLGYGFVPDDANIQVAEEIKPYLNGHWDNPDVQSILAGYNRKITEYIPEEPIVPAFGHSERNSRTSFSSASDQHKDRNLFNWEYF